MLSTYDPNQFSTCERGNSVTCKRHKSVIYVTHEISYIILYAHTQPWGLSITICEILG